MLEPSVEDQRPLGKRRSPWLAGAANLLLPPLGHIYAGQPLRGIIVFILSTAISMLATEYVALQPLRLPGYALLAAVLLAASVWVIADAVLVARRQGSSYALRSYNRWYIYLVAAVILAGLNAATRFGIETYVVRAYYIPSETMMPTLLIGDRVFVDKLTYRWLRPPQRRELIVFHAPRQVSPVPKEFLKRVIGLPNETVEIVPDRIMVDGRPLARLVSGAERADSEHDIVADGSANVTVAGSQLRIDGRPVVVLSSTGGASIRQDALSVDGQFVTSLGAGEMPEPQALPAGCRQAGFQGSRFTDHLGSEIYVVRGKRIAIDPGHVLVNGKSLGPEPYVQETARYANGPIHLGPNQYYVLGDNRNNSADSHLWGPLDGSQIVGKVVSRFWPPTRTGRVNGG
jgi:signal peptidase I